MSKDEDYIGVLLEDIRDNLKGVSEAVSDLNNKVSQISTRLESVETDTNLIPIIKAAVVDQTKQLDDHELRLSSIEAN